MNLLDELAKMAMHNNETPPPTALAGAPAAAATAPLFSHEPLQAAALQALTLTLTLAQARTLTLTLTLALTLTLTLPNCRRCLQGSPPRGSPHRGRRCCRCRRRRPGPTARPPRRWR